MRKLVTLTVVLVLTSCGGGSGGGHGDRLTPAEHLFGPGVGTGQTPSHIVPREDGAGFEILSFGAWGNVYDIKTTTERIDSPASGGWNMFSDISNNGHISLYDFLGQKKLDVEKNYRFGANASVENATFVGPAIMYSWVYGGGMHGATGSDYGTMKMQFGEDIASARIDFVMSNPSNNITTLYNGTCGSDRPCPRFTEDRKNVAITYETPGGVYQGTEGKTYIGYGAKK